MRRRLSRVSGLAAVLAATAALAGCAAARPAERPSVAASPPSATAPSAARPTRAPSAPPAACVPALAPGTHLVDLAGRAVIVSIPPRRAARFAAVLSLHGYDRTAQQQEDYTGLGTAGVGSGVLVLTPQGLGDPPAWDFPQRTAILPDDVSVLSQILATAVSRLCADPTRLVAAGYSDGADMAETLACARPGLLSAVVAVAPSVFPVNGCPAPVALVEIHGTADPIVPYPGGGGDRPYPFQGLAAQPVVTRMARWAQVDRCTGAPLTSALRPDVTEQRWPGCRLVLLSVAGGGHTWPGAVPTPQLGATAEDLSATALVLAVARGRAGALLGW